jgi:hypothetical protein
MPDSPVIEVRRSRRRVSFSLGYSLAVAAGWISIFVTMLVSAYGALTGMVTSAAAASLALFIFAGLALGFYVIASPVAFAIALRHRNLDLAMTAGCPLLAALAFAIAPSPSIATMIAVGCAVASIFFASFSLPRLARESKYGRPSDVKILGCGAPHVVTKVMPTAASDGIGLIEATPAEVEPS